MKKLLVVVDMQNDFIDGALGTREAEAIIKRILHKIKQYDAGSIYVTMDTHNTDYLTTMEGRYLPAEHCLEGTKGWALHEKIEAALSKAVIIKKPTFGSLALMEALYEESRKEELEIELVGLCTDICVVTNALLLKTRLPETLVRVDASCCAGVTPESHEAAIMTMKMCQVEVLNEVSKEVSKE